MYKVIIYSVLLVIGLILSQIVDLTSYSAFIHFGTTVCLSYIMIQIGLEFTIDKNNLSSYGKDYLIAASAAAFPWIFCAAYFYYVLGNSLSESLLIGRFAAPTSAGVLFAMLAAAGLGLTWLFQKARILAIFDDLDTILLMIPLQIIYVGYNIESFLLILLILVILSLAYFYLHTLHLPMNEWSLIVYSIGIVLLCELFKKNTEIELEVLLPAFAFGCMIYNPHNLQQAQPLPVAHDQSLKTKSNEQESWIDSMIKYFFMFLVGCSIPKIHLEDMSISAVAFHVLVITLLSNLGKMFPVCCYRKEASLWERVALSVAIFPRGEVGAGVLLVATHYELTQITIGLGALSLALNLVLTGFFIMTVIWLISSGEENK